MLYNHEMNPFVNPSDGKVTIIERSLIPLVINPGIMRLEIPGYRERQGYYTYFNGGELTNHKIPDRTAVLIKGYFTNKKQYRNHRLYRAFIKDGQFYSIK